MKNRILMLIALTLLALGLWLLRNQKQLYAPLHLWRRPERPDWPQLATFARLGIPAGLAIGVEVTSFTLMALFIARQGTLASAGHQIASNLGAVLYMVPLSIAIAASARVSFRRGAGDEARARAVVWTALKLSTLMSLALAATLFSTKEAFAAIYSNQADVVRMSADLLGWVALYHLADALQTLCVFILRCYRITVWPLVVYCLLLWGVGLGGGYWLAYHGVGPWPAAHSPLSFWQTSTLALAVTASIFAWMLHRVTKPSHPAPTL